MVIVEVDDQNVIAPLFSYGENPIYCPHNFIPSSPLSPFPNCQNKLALSFSAETLRV